MFAWGDLTGEKEEGQGFGVRAWWSLAGLVGKGEEATDNDWQRRSLETAGHRRGMCRVWWMQ